MEDLFAGTEQLVLCEDRGVPLRAVIAIDDTTLGPSLGGVRWKAYPSDATAVMECRRLARAMTLKHAAAGLPYGGGKAVVLEDGEVRDRDEVMRAFGRFVARLGGAYIPGVDMGTTVSDLKVIGEVAPDVACDDEDPSPWTALGVYAGIRAATEAVEGRSLHGVRVAVQGVGAVGAALARLLAGDGARLLVSDVDEARAVAVADEVGGEVVTLDEIVEADVDVLAPCAVARVIDRSTVGRLRCRIVAGAANDVLAEPERAADLQQAGVSYVPDFLINAGGVIHIHGLRAGWSEDRLRDEVLGIGDRVHAVLRDAGERATTPLAAAEALADAVLARGARDRARP